MITSTPRISGDALLGGGTISGNLTITGNLTVQGTTTSVVNQTTSGTVTIQKTSTTAFRVQTDAGASTIFTVDTTNSQLLMIAGTVGNPAYSWAAEATTGWYRAGSNDIRMSIGGVDQFRYTVANFVMQSASAIVWGSSGVTNGDVFLLRDNAGTLAQRNSTNAQSFRIYNTFTSSTNFEHYRMSWQTSSNVMTIATGADNSNNGTVRSILIQPDTQNPINTAGANVSVIAGAGSATNAAGGQLNLTGGAGIGNGVGGAVVITGGAAAASTTTSGGAVTVGGGANGTSAGVAGAGTFKGGDASASGTGGAVTLRGGDSSGSSSGTGGGVTIRGGGASNSSGAGSAVSITGGAAGTGNNAAAGGTLTLQGGAASTNGSATGSGGAVNITGGNAGGGVANGGAITINTGAKSSTGLHGVLSLQVGGTNVIVGDGTGLGFFNHATAAQQTVGANVNNVASSGTTGQFDDFTNGTVYATDYSSLHNTVYQLTRSVAQITVALRNLGLGA